MHHTTKRKLESELSDIARPVDPLEELQREIVGKAVRLHIPLRDVPDLGRISIILRVLASRLEVLSKGRGTEIEGLFNARQAIKLANAQLGRRSKIGRSGGL